MKRFLFLATFLLCATSIFAQQSSVKGSLIDPTNDEGVIGAVVELTPLNINRVPYVVASGYGGTFTINGVDYGDYIIKADFLGYETYVDTLKINTPRVVLSRLNMRQSSTEIDAVVKEVQAMRTSQRGDTVSYNADAFKVASDADVEGLLKKMPGITIDNGEVTAQGETIQKIFVDGREFFGNDVATAISSLPAEIVENIEVYDKLSDNAELSGMDDGEGYKSINIVTRKNMREGFFGKVYAGGGYQPEIEGDLTHAKYMMGGNVNYFTGKHRFSVLGLLNNINQQNFSFDDVLGLTDGNGYSARNYMTRPQAGVADVGALGLNYSGAFGESDKVKLEASYFYNGTQTQNFSSTDKWFEAPLDIDTLNTATDSYTPNYNHRVTGRVEWKTTPTQQVTLRQNSSFQFNNAESTTLGAQYGESGYTILDSYNLNDKEGYSSSTSLSYVSRLGKPGRTIAVNGSMWLNNQDNITHSSSNDWGTYTNADGSPVDASQIEGILIANPDMLSDISYKTQFRPTSTISLNGNTTYSEPIGEHAQFLVKYNYSNKNQETENMTYNTGDNFVVAPDATPIAASSNSYTSNYITHQIGPGLYYTDGKSKLSMSANYQLSKLTGEALTTGATEAEPISNTYKNFNYSLSGQLFFNPTNSLRLKFYTKSSDPWVGYLVNSYNVNNSNYISKGNPYLDPAYTMNLRTQYVRSNIERGSTFMIMGGFEHQNDYIGNHVIYKPGDITVGDATYSPLQFSMPVNFDEDYWSLRAMMEYGFPISPIKCNFNLRGGINYKLTPSMFGGTFDSSTGLISGGTVNNTESVTYDINTVLGSNISENVDFTLSWRGEYSEATNSAATTSEVNTYLSQTASANMKFVFGAGFTLTGAATYKEYKGITNDYQDSYVLCNLFVGKKIFRNQRGELNIGVNDLFNQNTSFARSVGSGFTQNTYNSVIGRYFSMQLVYNLRSFGGQKGGGGHRGPGMGGGGAGHPMRGM